MIEAQIVIILVLTIQVENLQNLDGKMRNRVLGIDEFRGNANGEKFQVILTDLKEHKVLDILPKRSENYLLRYFFTSASYSS